VNIVLIGFMGTGKSAVGRRLAERLERPFIELDRIIEEREGCSIAEIFERRGEAHFRRIERAAVHVAAQLPDVVIATGGGAVLDDENVKALKATGILVCLTAAPEVIRERLGDVRTRPLLSGAADPLAEIKRLLAARAPRYALADHIVDVSHLLVDDVVESVVHLVTRGA